MTRLWERLAGRPAGRSIDTIGDLNDLGAWLSVMGANGLYGGAVKTTAGALSEENVPVTHSEAFRGSSPIFALVSARMQAFSQARFQWTRFKSGKPTELFGGPELRILEQPWPGGTTADLLARMELDVSTAGNSYTCLSTDGTQVHRLYPQWMYVVLGSNTDADHPGQAWDAEVIGYVYRPPNARMKYFLPEDVAHYAPIPDPDFSFVGMSWMTPVIRDMRADSLMTEHKAAFLKNAATPNLAVKFDATVSPEQAAEFKQLMEAEHQGALNAWKTLYVGGGSDVTVVGTNFKELEFSATQGKGESRMASAAGVPPSWVGFSEGLQGSALNAGNFSTARRRFSDGTMAHLWGNAASSLQVIVRPPKKRGASLWYDLSSAPFMREDAQDLATIQASQAATLLSLLNAGFTAKSAVDAVVNNDMTVLEHTGLTSVQLLPPSDGKEPVAADQTDGAPPAVAPNPTTPPAAPEGGQPNDD